MREYIVEGSDEVQSYDLSEDYSRLHPTARSHDDEFTGQTPRSLRSPAALSRAQQAAF